MGRGWSLHWWVHHHGAAVGHGELPEGGHAVPVAVGGGLPRSVTEAPLCCDPDAMCTGANHHHTSDGVEANQSLNYLKN